MLMELKKPDMVQEAAKTGGKNLFIEILMFLGVYLVTMLVMGITMTPVLLAMMFGNEEYVRASMSGDIDAVLEIQTRMLDSDGITIFSLFITIVMILVPMLFCKLLQKRKMRTLGFKKAGMWKEYGLGLVIGFAMMGIEVLICVITGAIQLEFNSGILTAAGMGVLLLLLIGFMFQGMSEEVFCRGYFLVSIARKKGNIWLGVIVNAVAFGLLHLANAGLTVLSMVNLILFGIFASVYFVKRGNIWGVAAIHTIWNFTQGNVFGILVSGGSFGTTVFKSTINEEMTILNGGSFGLEGGILTTIVLIVATILTLMLKQKDVAQEIPASGEMLTEQPAQ